MNSIYEEMIDEYKKDVDDIDKLIANVKRDLKKKHTSAERTQIEKRLSVLCKMKCDLIGVEKELIKRIKRY